MKDYLKCSLTEDEKDLINGMIWRTAKTFKQRLYKKNLRKTISIDEVALCAEDKYDVYNLEIVSCPRPLRPYTKEEKNKIVCYIDSLLSELSLSNFKKALTFDEKLVLFLYYFQKHIEEDVAILLGVTRRTIVNKKKSIDNKRIELLGGIKNV